MRRRFFRDRSATERCTLVHLVQKKELPERDAPGDFGSLVRTGPVPMTVRHPKGKTFVNERFAQLLSPNSEEFGKLCSKFVAMTAGDNGFLGEQIDAKKRKHSNSFSVDDLNNWLMVGDWCQSRAQAGEIAQKMLEANVFHHALLFSSYTEYNPASKLDIFKLGAPPTSPRRIGPPLMRSPYKSVSPRSEGSDDRSLSSSRNDGSFASRDRRSRDVFGLSGLSKDSENDPGWRQLLNPLDDDYAVLVSVCLSLEICKEQLFKEDATPPSRRKGASKVASAEQVVTWLMEGDYASSHAHAIHLGQKLLNIRIICPHSRNKDGTIFCPISKRDHYYSGATQESGAALARSPPKAPIPFSFK